MNKKLISGILVLAAVLNFGCAKKKTYLEFDMPYTANIAVPALTANTTYTFYTKDIATEISSILESKNTDADKVGEATYTSFNIAVNTPTTSSLSHIRSIKFYVNAYNQPEQQVAFKYNETKRDGSGNITVDDSIRPGVKSTTLHVNDPNVKNRFMENVVFYKVKIDPLYSVPAMTLTITHNIHVKAISE